jgi:hypothetical protein
MNSIEEQVNSEKKNKPLRSWQKYLILLVLGTMIAVVGQALKDLGFISNKWWLVTSLFLVAYWFLFIRKEKIKYEQDIEYDWTKRRKK